MRTRVMEGTLPLIEGNSKATSAAVGHQRAAWTGMSWDGTQAGQAGCREMVASSGGGRKRDNTWGREQNLSVQTTVLLIVLHTDGVKALANSANRLVSRKNALAWRSNSVLIEGREPSSKTKQVPQKRLRSPHNRRLGAQKPTGEGGRYRLRDRVSNGTATWVAQKARGDAHDHNREHQQAKKGTLKGL